VALLNKAGSTKDTALTDMQNTPRTPEMRPNQAKYRGAWTATQRSSIMQHSFLPAACCWHKSTDMYAVKPRGVASVLTLHEVASDV